MNKASECIFLGAAYAFICSPVIYLVKKLKMKLNST